MKYLTAITLTILFSSAVFAGNGGSEAPAGSPIPDKFPADTAVCAVCGALGKDCKEREMPKFRGRNINYLAGYLNSVVKYPVEAWDNDEEGTVVCSFEVDKDGKVKNIIIRESPRIYFSEAVIKVLRTLKGLEPARLHGYPVKAGIRQKIIFKLITGPDHRSSLR